MSSSSEKWMLRLHKAGLLRLATFLSSKTRKIVLEGVHYNTDLITNRMARVDLLTDSLMHSPDSLKLPTTKSARESSFIALQDSVKKCFGYDHILPVAQGRTAELILASTLAKPDKIIPNNLLFPTTRLNPEIAGSRPIAIPVKEAYNTESDYPFKGNLDIDALQELIHTHGADNIAYIMVEVSVNASGGHPVSMSNIKAVYRIARTAGVPLFIDGCRILENACLIREREQGYENYPIADIVRDFFSHSDGCTMSATKDFPVDMGGFIATRREDLYYRFLDFTMLAGEGLSVDAKARLYKAVRKSFCHERMTRRRVHLTKRFWQRLAAENLPVVYPASGYAVFINSRELLEVLSEEQFPERAFLARLYAESGILGGENMLTPEQKKHSMRMLRFIIPPGRYSNRIIDYTAKHISSLWHRRREIRGLKQTYVPPCQSGDFMAHYEPD